MAAPESGDFYDEVHDTHLEVLGVYRGHTQKEYAVTADQMVAGRVGSCFTFAAEVGRRLLGKNPRYKVALGITTNDWARRNQLHGFAAVSQEEDPDNWLLSDCMFAGAVADHKHPELGHIGSAVDTPYHYRYKIDDQDHVVQRPPAATFAWPEGSTHHTTWMPFRLGSTAFTAIARLAGMRRQSNQETFFDQLRADKPFLPVLPAADTEKHRGRRVKTE